MRRLIQTSARALFAFAVLLLYPVVALLGAPWAFFTSLGSWGHTPWREWVESFEQYSPEGLRGAWRFVKTGREG